jgi:hypothetical protein
MAAGANMLKKLRPQAPVYSTFDPTGPPGIPVAVGGSGPHPRYKGTAQYSPDAMRNYSQANTDYEEAMATMRQDAAEHVQKWSNEMAPASGDIGQYRKAPALLSPVDQLVGKAPVGDLYGGHDVSSIVNLRKRKERGFA